MVLLLTLSSNKLAQAFHNCCFRNETNTSTLDCTSSPYLLYFTLIDKKIRCAIYQASLFKIFPFYIKPCGISQIELIWNSIYIGRHYILSQFNALLCFFMNYPEQFTQRDKQTIIAGNRFGLGLRLQERLIARDPKAWLHNPNQRLFNGYSHIPIAFSIID